MEGTMKKVLDDAALYEGDNGRIFCGACAGSSAAYTGRDISGQKVHKMTVADADAMERELADIGYTCSCESCGKGFSRIVVAR